MRKLIARAYIISLFMPILRAFLRPPFTTRRLRNRVNHVPSILRAAHVIRIRYV